MNGRVAIKAFKAELEKHRVSGRVVWLDYDQMHLSGRMLHVFRGSEHPTDNEVAAVYDNQNDRFDCGATFMLVAASDDQAYCTLLMDAFGSESNVEIEKGIYVWAEEPYVKSIKLSTSRFQWCLRKLTPRALSSLDYAFKIKQAYT